MADSIDLLERALDQTADLIGGIRPDQASLPTPCAEWDVRALVRHLVRQDLRNFVIAAKGENADWGAPTDELGDDWAGDFREGARELIETWRNADLERPVPMPGGRTAPLRSRADHQITELAVHGWDLARATGQNRELAPELAEHALAWARGMLRPEFRGPDKAFGMEVRVDDDAPVYDRLAGWFGRDPSWRPN